MSRDEELAWEVFMQGLDVTSGELVDGERKECENPLTSILDHHLTSSSEPPTPRGWTPR